MHLAALGFTLGRQAEAWFGLSSAARDKGRRQPPDFRTMLEPMAGAPTNQHDVGHRRMAVDEEVAVRAILILADFSSRQLRASEQWETTVAEGNNLLEGGSCEFARLSVRIDQYPMLVVGKFDAARFEVGEAIIHVAGVEVGPAWHGFRQEAAIALRWGEIEDLLPGRENSIAKQVRERFLQPWAESEDE